MAGMVTYFSHGLLTGSPSTLADFRSELQRFCRDQTVYLCSSINSLLRSWLHFPDLAAHDALLKMFFDAATAERFIKASKDPEPKLVFHRQQMLFIAKEAILCCPETGLNPLNPQPSLLANLLLRANDHFYTPHPAATDLEQKMLNLLVDVIPSFEYSAPRDLRNAIARSHLMYSRFADELKCDSCYMDINARFRRMVNFTSDEFMALCFGLLSKYLEANIQSFVANAASLFVQEEYFQHVAVDADAINRFKKELSATPAELKRVFERKLTGPSDFTLFRAKPLYRSGTRLFCIDPGFLVEKLQTGPFWRTMPSSHSSKEAGDAFIAFWGRVFERYLNWLLTESVGTNNRHNQFFPRPRYESDGNEVCDGLMLCGSDAVFMEYKGGVFTAKSKYAGDPTTLRAEIEEKLIRNPEGRHKGIEQLAEAIRRTCRRNDAERIVGVELSSVRRVFPLLILGDGIGDTPMINALLNHRFQGTKSLSRKTVRPKALTPLFCMAADTLEYVAAFLEDASLGDILDARYQSNKGMDQPFLGTRNAVLEALGDKGSSVLANVFNEFFEPLVKRLFPEGAAQGTVH